MSFDGSLKTIQLNKTVIDSDLLVWAEHLRRTLSSGNYEEFCHNKCELTPDNDLQLVWKFLKTTFQSNPKEIQLDLLGYSTEKVNNIASQFYNNLNGFKKNSTDEVIKICLISDNLIIVILIVFLGDK